MKHIHIAVALVFAVIAGIAGLDGESSAGEVVVVTSFPKELFETYKREFEAKHPDVTVVVKSEG